MKYQRLGALLLAVCRSPCGERGLKLAVLMWLCGWAAESLPVRGAWIEMPHPSLLHKKRASLPVRGAWIEMTILRH